MREVSYNVFAENICKDYNISDKVDIVLQNPLLDNKRLKKFTQGIADSVRIFDGEKEHPYMLEYNKRNEEVIKKATELRYLRTKTLSEVIKETGVKLKTKAVQISEGGGWYSKGRRYEYKGIYIEI